MNKDNEKHVEARPARGEVRAERPQRVPINGTRDILAVKGIKPDMHPCWVNEENVPRYLDAGYTFVDYNVTFGSYAVDQGNPLGARYARDVGMGQVAYLMEQPLELFNKDRADEQAEINRDEAGIYQHARDQGLDHGNIGLSADVK